MENRKKSDNKAESPSSTPARGAGRYNLRPQCPQKQRDDDTSHHANYTFSDAAVIARLTGNAEQSPHVRQLRSSQQSTQTPVNSSFLVDASFDQQNHAFSGLPEQTSAYPMPFNANSVLNQNAPIQHRISSSDTQHAYYSQHHQFQQHMPIQLQHQQHQHYQHQQFQPLPQLPPPAQQQLQPPLLEHAALLARHQQVQGNPQGPMQGLPLGSGHPRDSHAAIALAAPLAPVDARDDEKEVKECGEEDVAADVADVDPSARLMMEQIYRLQQQLLELQQQLPPMSTAYPPYVPAPYPPVPYPAMFPHQYPPAHATAAPGTSAFPASPYPYGYPHLPRGYPSYPAQWYSAPALGPPPYLRPPSLMPGVGMGVGMGLDAGAHEGVSGLATPTRGDGGGRGRARSRDEEDDSEEHSYRKKPRHRHMLKAPAPPGMKTPATDKALKRNMTVDDEEEEEEEEKAPSRTVKKLTPEVPGKRTGSATASAVCEHCQNPIMKTSGIDMSDYRTHAKTCYNDNHWSNLRTADNPYGYTETQAKNIASAPTLRKKWKETLDIMKQRYTENKNRGLRMDMTKVIEDMVEEINAQYKAQVGGTGNISASAQSQPSLRSQPPSLTMMEPQVKTEGGNANGPSITAITIAASRSNPIPSPSTVTASVSNRGSSRGTRASSVPRTAPKPKSSVVRRQTQMLSPSLTSSASTSASVAADDNDGVIVNIPPRRAPAARRQSIPGRHVTIQRFLNKGASDSDSSGEGAGVKAGVNVSADSDDTEGEAEVVLGSNIAATTAAAATTDSDDNSLASAAAYDEGDVDVRGTSTAADVPGRAYSDKRVTKSKSTVLSITNTRFHDHWSHQVSDTNEFGYTEEEIDYIDAARCQAEAKERELAFMEKRIRNEEARIRDAPHLSGSDDEFGLKRLSKMRQQIQKKYEDYD